ncbi:MAG: T9SS type A sorting domain-containing protein [Bacteroidales bacterium]|nr:T9SS type A sorting domain-containing protein [Bacteroidales bacterium]
MKKLFLTFALSLSVIFLMAQAVQRSYVVLEIGTGTWCTYCPGAANGAHDLLASGAQVAVIENHNGDPFANTPSNARNSYYGITGYPTAFFDGTGSLVGGAACPNGNNFSSYQSLYNTAYAVQSPLTINISGTNTGNTYNITIAIQKLATITASDLKVHLVLTESNIATAPWPGSGGCMNDVNHVTRLMAPNENGTPLSFTSGDFQVVNLSFTKDPSWVDAECEVVAFVQSNGAKTIYNAMKKPLLGLAPPLTVDFTGTPTSGCSPLNTNFTGTAPGANTWQWSFPGGNPSTSNLQNPTVTYSTAGTYDVSLTAWNTSTGSTGSKVKSAYISVTSSPGTPGMPQGSAGMCANPPNENYTTSGATGASSYTWELTPAAAGVITPSGTSCTVNFDDLWTGTAQLRVKAANSCGDGPWSPALSITVSEQPSTPGTPSGPDFLCMNAPNTDYTASGGIPSTSYNWELLPYDAGALYPSGSTCTVDWVDTFMGNATLRVKAMNGSCESGWSGYLDITISGGPTAYTVTGGGAYCGQGGTGSPVGLEDSETGVNYTLYLDGSATTNVVAGTGSAISFGDQLGAGDYTVVGANASAGCDNTMNGIATVSIDPEPPYEPGEPQGPAQVYTGSTPTSDYITSGGQYATSYSWELTPAAAGTVDGNTTTGTVTWDQSYSGPAEIKVQGVNACGGGSYSISFEVTVDIGVGIPVLSGSSMIRLYPNPAKNSVTLISEQSGKAEISFFNTFGKSVLYISNIELSETSQIDISTLPAGIYLVRVKSDGKTESLKMIVE